MEKNKQKLYRWPKELNRKAILPLEEDAIANLGWFLHYTWDEPQDRIHPNQTNIHTHGLATNFDHPDLQICLNIEQGTALMILWQVFDNYISKGEKLEAGREYDRVLGNDYKVKVVKAFECGREVLRLCIPDKNHSFSEPKYAAQLTMLSDENPFPN